MKAGNGSITAAVAIIALSLMLGLRTINDYPAHIHAWAQGDWYAISLGFHQNGFDFFHPETAIYNKQFPGYWMEDYGNTVTSVDFPIHNYIIALLMKLFGTTEPWVYRGWTLLCSMVGLWFLFLLGQRLTSNTVKSLLVVAVALTSPLYTYYFNNFLISAPALALTTAALWSYVKYYQTDSGRHWNVAVALLTVATMMRTSHAVALVAVFVFELIRVLRKESIFRKRFPAVVASIVLITGYMLWNAHLRNQNGSIFLGSLTPPHSWEDVATVRSKVRWLWMYRYFSKLQQILLACAVGGAIVSIAVRRRRTDTQTQKTGLWLLLLIWWLGEAAFCVAMMRQFIDHDYYFLDSLFLPVLFLLLLSLKRLPELRGILAPIGWLAVVLLVGSMYNEAKHKLKKTVTDNDRSVECFANYEGSGDWLDEQGVPREARILSLFSYPQNTPFIQMKRKGYSLMWCDKQQIDHAIRFAYDYIVVEDIKARELFETEECSFMKNMRRLAGNGRISLAVMTDSVVNHTVDDFFLVPDCVQPHDSHFVANRSDWFPEMPNHKAFFSNGDAVPTSRYGDGGVGEQFDTVASWGYDAIRVCPDALPDDCDIRTESCRYAYRTPAISTM